MSVKYLNKELPEQSEVTTQIDNKVGNLTDAAGTSYQDSTAMSNALAAGLDTKIGDLTDTAGATYASATGMINTLNDAMDARVDELTDKISTVYTFCGAEATVAAIAAHTDAKKGDCYFCNADSHTYTASIDEPASAADWIDTSGQFENEAVLNSTLHPGKGYFQIANLPANADNLVSNIVQWVNAAQTTDKTNTGKLETGHLYQYMTGTDSWRDLTVAIISAHIDAALSATSENAVQNKVVTAALDAKQDLMQYSDPAVLSDATIAVGDIFQWTGASTLYDATAIIKGHFYQATETLGSRSYTEVDLNTNMFIGTLAQWNALSLNEKAQYKLVYRTDDASSGSAIAMDPAPMYGSMNAVTSEGIRAAIDAGGSGSGVNVNMRITSGSDVAYLSYNPGSGDVAVNPTVLLGLGASVGVTVFKDGVNLYRGSIVQQDTGASSITVMIPMSNGIAPATVGATDIMLINLTYDGSAWHQTSSFNRGTQAAVSYDAVNETLSLVNNA